MLKKKYNDNWRFMRGSDNPLADGVMNASQASEMIHLPHDAMAYEQRNRKVLSGSQSGFYPGGNYVYIKKFDVPNEWEKQSTIFEFEGVYANAKVFINGAYAGGCNNGYRNFYIHANMFLLYGELNEIKVAVNNSGQPNSRWYSGSGIYRDVNILQSELLHLGVDGISITTPEVDNNSAMVVIKANIVNDGYIPKSVSVVTELLDLNKQIVGSEITKLTVFIDETTMIQRIYIKDVNLWDTDNPYLYTCNIRVLQDSSVLDEECIKFGVRDLKLDEEHGLRINGKTIKLRGTCLHHDNGIIGATTLYAAEERRCRLLKDAGFNCIRSAHQPISKAFLTACDSLGMLVIDELSDVWNVCKNNNDYATFFQGEWEEDIVQMVMKDVNHPSVIMYCLGNELAEAGTKKGAELNRKINDVIKRLDSTRYTTNAINGLTAAADKLPLIFAEFMPDQQEEPSNDHNVSGNGSGDVNSMMSILVGPLSDAVACHPIMSDRIEEFVSGTDVAGYNYMTARHELEHQLHPNRIVLGTETFPSEIARLWKIVKENNHVIGDMTWTGYDYLGEAGIGNFYYDEGRPFSNHYPDLLAYCGDIDIIGIRRVISYYREIVFGLRKVPYICVHRVNHFGEECLKTPWAFKDYIESWTWEGYENKETIVDVYSDADEIELFLNEVSIGRKQVGMQEAFIASFPITYQPGILRAMCYREGLASEMQTLKTAENDVQLFVEVDKTELVANGEDLLFLEISLIDKFGNINFQQEKEVQILIEGPGILEGFGSSIPQTENSYKNSLWKSYDGHLLAAIRSTTIHGEIQVVLQTDTEKKVVTILSH